jgi:hypothetical protein
MLLALVMRLRHRALRRRADELEALVATQTRELAGTVERLRLANATVEEKNQLLADANSRLLTRDDENGAPLTAYPGPEDAFRPRHEILLDQSPAFIMTAALLAWSCVSYEGASYDAARAILNGERSEFAPGKCSPRRQVFTEHPVECIVSEGADPRSGLTHCWIRLPAEGDST